MRWRIIDPVIMKLKNKKCQNIVAAERVICHKIKHIIQINLASYLNINGELEVIKLDRDYWSIIIIYKIKPIEYKEPERYIFCKLPKYHWWISSLEDITRHDFELSQEMGRSEFDSLTFLYKEIEGVADKSLGVVKPLDYLPEYNAILTEGIKDSAEVFELLRVHGDDKFIGGQVAALLRKIGLWLGHIHSVGMKRRLEFELKLPFVEQLQDSYDTARQMGENSLADKFLRYSGKLQKICPKDIDKTDRSLTIEGFEVRNFITDGEGVFFLDPGHIYLGSIYEDLARFVASVSLLYWGSISFIVAYRNAEIFVNLFLDAYQQEVKIFQNNIFLIYLAKEYLRLWSEGLKVLQFKKYWKPFHKITQLIYIERFFTKKLNEIMPLIS